MNGINIYLQTSNNGFWYDHGVELFAAFVTLVAFLFTFRNVIRTNDRQEREEQKKNEKTLKMIDLATKEKTEKLKEINKKISEKIKSEHKPDDEGLYDLHIDKQSMHFSTQIKIMVNLNDVAKYVRDSDLHLTLPNYQETIKSLLINQHTNLNLKAIEKVTTRLENIESVLKKLDELKTYTYVSNAIIRGEEDNAQEELKKYGELNELIEKLSKELYS